MIAGVADTHAALWFLFGDARLSLPARGFLEVAAASKGKIAVSTVSLVEIVYLIEKKRLFVTAYKALEEALANPLHIFEESHLTAGIVEAMWQVSRSEVPDMPDRIIADTGIYLGVPVISRDGRIRAANLTSIW